MISKSFFLSVFGHRFVPVFRLWSQISGPIWSRCVVIVVVIIVTIVQNPTPADPQQPRAPCDHGLSHSPHLTHIRPPSNLGPLCVLEPPISPSTPYPDLPLIPLTLRPSLSPHIAPRPPPSHPRPPSPVTSPFSDSPPVTKHQLSHVTTILTVQVNFLWNAQFIAYIHVHVAKVHG